MPQGTVFSKKKLLRYNMGLPESRKYPDENSEFSEETIPRVISLILMRSGVCLEDNNIHNECR